MNWDVKLDDASIKDEVVEFTIRRRVGSFCNEMLLSLASDSLYDQFDFTEVPGSARIEILTDTGSGFVSQGFFFVERPDVLQSPQGVTIPSLWGRDKGALLTQPFAQKINKEWDEDTTALGIIQEMLELCGLSYSAARMEISDYTIFAGTYQAKNQYPIDVVSDLATKTDGWLMTDRSGNVWVKKWVFSFGSPSRTFDDGPINAIRERVEFPTFGNRIKVGSLNRDWDANLNISLQVEESTIYVGGDPSPAKAIVTHLDSRPVADGHAVTWTSDNASYAHWQHGTTHVHTEHIETEEQRASGRRRISTEFPIRQVYSVKVPGSEVDYYAGGEFKGTSITLGSSLPFTDSTVIIDYEAGGIASNSLIPGSTGEVEVDVHAIVEQYIRDTATVRVDSESGQEQGDKDMYVTVIVKDFINLEPVATPEIIVDSQSRGNADENGEMDLGLMTGGIHLIRVLKTGYQDTEGDGLDNDQFYCGE